MVRVAMSGFKRGRAYTDFLARYPEFDSTSGLDELRASQYSRLDREQVAYLDYTGGSLYAESQVREHAALLAGGVFGNPHSAGLTSSAMTTLVDRARRAGLTWFKAQGEYTARFHQNFLRNLSR